MISILPEHAPPVSTKDTKLKLIVADDVLVQFPREEAAYILNAFAEDVVKDLKHLESTGLLPGGQVDIESLELALNFMVVTEQDETVTNEKYTKMFHKLIFQKFLWNIL